MENAETGDMEDIETTAEKAEDDFPMRNDVDNKNNDRKQDIGIAEGGS